jgi:branched-subunit amino acid aminotransferase/4-amino-4-deoxychorismate lyase
VFRVIIAGPLVVLALVFASGAQAELPSVDKVDRARLRAHCERLLEALAELKSPLPSETEHALKALLQDHEKDAADFSAEVQKLLDPHCLIAVTINPESRVKALRGPAAAELQQDRETVLLVKVVNEAGVTGAMAVAGPQLRGDGQTGEGRWLQASLLAGPPRGKGLSGDRLEYVLLRLKAHESGKREATLKFDVGQGTQDLGFRAEVPVLFTVRPAER